MTEVNTEKKTVYGYTDFKTALNWCNNDFVLMNKVSDDYDMVSEIDSDYRQSLIDDEGYTEEDADNEYAEVYQWLVTDASYYDLKYLEETFGIKAYWSEKYEINVIPVMHCGTPWNSVPCSVYSEEWWKINGDTKKFQG